MNKAVFVKRLPRSAEAPNTSLILVRFEPSYQGHDYAVVTSEYNRAEVFPADKNGQPTSQEPLTARTGSQDRGLVLWDIGYSLRLN